jgi:hypothetical protein
MKFMADLPDLKQTSLLFAGEVAALDPEVHTRHGSTTQVVSYKNIVILMGPKSYFKDPFDIFHPVDKNKHGLDPDLFKIGTKLIIGTESLYFANYVHRFNLETKELIHQALQKFIQNFVNSYLKDHNFDIGLVTDDDKAYLDGDELTLRQIAERATDQLQDKTGDIPESHDVLACVQEYRKRKKDSDTSSPWTFIFQLGASPTNTLWAYRPQPPGSLRSWQWNGATQGAAGFQYGQLGWTHTFMVTGSIGASSGIFQNALGAYQLSLAGMLGNPIDASGASKTWTYLVGSVFGQIGVGGNNYAYGVSKVVRIGFLAQASAGGQLALNIGSVQVIGQGALLYSLPYDKSTTNVGRLDSTFGAALWGGVQVGF